MPKTVDFSRQEGHIFTPTGWQPQIKCNFLHLIINNLSKILHFFEKIACLLK